MHTQSSHSYAKHSNLTVLFGNDTGHNVIYSVGGCVEIEIPKLEMENHLREKRQAHALSQKQLADLAGITRQAISALESNQYSPATSVALQLARALQCRVEDLSGRQFRAQRIPVGVSFPTGIEAISSGDANTLAKFSGLVSN